MPKSIAVDKLMAMMTDGFYTEPLTTSSRQLTAKSRHVVNDGGQCTHAAMSEPNFLPSALTVRRTDGQSGGLRVVIRDVQATQQRLVTSVWKVRSLRTIKTECIRTARMILSLYLLFNYFFLSLDRIRAQDFLCSIHPPTPNNCKALLHLSDIWWINI